MGMRYFDSNHLKILDEAVYISEDVSSDQFSLSNDYWINNSYEIRTLKKVSPGEYPGKAFAQLVRYGRSLAEKQSGQDVWKFYRICLHDQNILNQTSGGERKKLFPFLIYVITHEFIHIIRFSRYCCRLETDDHAKEEQKVHLMTHDILAPLKIKGLDEVFKRFRPYLELGAKEKIDWHFCIPSSPHF
ncbi:MAG: hypothetical protein GWP10_02830 [Nitrospiraceae bacterium]|nr:hypothetical protein [Nitrospiraceae bacterium]